MRFDKGCTGAAGVASEPAAQPATAATSPAPIAHPNARRVIVSLLAFGPTGDPVDAAQQRVEGRVRSLQKTREKIVIPTPVVALSTACPLDSAARHLLTRPSALTDNTTAVRPGSSYWRAAAG